MTRMSNHTEFILRLWSPVHKYYRHMSDGCADRLLPAALVRLIVRAVLRFGSDKHFFLQFVVQ